MTKEAIGTVGRWVGGLLFAAALAVAGYVYGAGAQGERINSTAIRVDNLEKTKADKSLVELHMKYIGEQLAKIEKKLP